MDNASSRPVAIRGQHVMVLGGSSGIGRAVAELALRSGAWVTILARNKERLVATVDQLRHLGSIGYAELDMTNERAVDQIFSNIASSSIHHIVISASSAVHGAFADVSTEQARLMFESKFFGPYRVERASLPALAPGGSLNFFSGVLSRRPGMNCSALGAVNAAIEGLTRALALELGPRLRVNCCSPGMVRSEAYSGMPDAKRLAMYDATGASLPLGRVGETLEIAEAVYFMMTNSYLTGQVIDIDGGHLIRQYATR